MSWFGKIFSIGSGSKRVLEYRVFLDRLHGLKNWLCDRKPRSVSSRTQVDSCKSRLWSLGTEWPPQSWGPNPPRGPEELLLGLCIFATAAVGLGLGLKLIGVPSREFPADSYVYPLWSFDLSEGGLFRALGPSNKPNSTTTLTTQPI